MHRRVGQAGLVGLGGRETGVELVPRSGGEHLAHDATIGRAEFRMVGCLIDMHRPVHAGQMPDQVQRADIHETTVGWDGRFCELVFGLVSDTDRIELLPVALRDHPLAERVSAWEAVIAVIVGGGCVVTVEGHFVVTVEQVQG